MVILLEAIFATELEHRLLFRSYDIFIEVVLTPNTSLCDGPRHVELLIAGCNYSEEFARRK